MYYLNKEEENYFLYFYYFTYSMHRHLIDFEKKHTHI